MKYQLYILFLIVALMGCTTSRKSTNTNVANNDSIVTNTAQHSNESNTREKETVTNDSLIGVPEKTVDDSLSREEQEIPRTKKGVAKPVYKENTKDGLTAWILIDTSGNIKFGAKSDSFNLLVRNLVREREIIKQRYDHLSAWVQNQKRSSTTNVETVIVKEKSWWDKNWKLIGIGICALIAGIIWLFKK